MKTNSILFAASVLAAGLISFGAARAQTAPSLAGVWMVESPSTMAKTVDGKAPPLTKAAAAAYKAAQAARAKGDWSADTVEACLPHGLPRLMSAPYPIEILQEPKQITFVHEAQHMLRLVYLDEPLPPDDELDNNYMGASVGAWRDGALVVDSKGFNTRTTIDAAGMPHSDKLSLREEFRLLDGGDRLEDLITITDPDTFTRPWTMKVTFKRQPGRRLQQYVCSDVNPEAHAKAAG